jgi:hypothetical protein
MPKQFPDLPWGRDMIVEWLEWLDHRQEFSSLDLENYLADYHKLTTKQRAYTFGSGLPAWPNHVAWLTADLVVISWIKLLGKKGSRHYRVLRVGTPEEFKDELQPFLEERRQRRRRARRGGR